MVTQGIQDSEGVQDLIGLIDQGVPQGLKGSLVSMGKPDTKRHVFNACNASDAVQKSANPGVSKWC